jgi:hypothetical protein
MLMYCKGGVARFMGHALVLQDTNRQWRCNSLNDNIEHLIRASQTAHYLVLKSSTSRLVLNEWET